MKRAESSKETKRKKRHRRKEMALKRCKAVQRLRPRPRIKKKLSPLTTSEGHGLRGRLVGVGHDAVVFCARHDNRDKLRAVKARVGIPRAHGIGVLVLQTGPKTYEGRRRQGEGRPAVRVARFFHQSTTHVAAVSSSPAVNTVVSSSSSRLRTEEGRRLQRVTRGRTGAL